MGKGDIQVAPVPGIGYAQTERKGKSSMFAMIPLLGLSVVIYAIGTYSLSGDLLGDWVIRDLATITMVSGDAWLITFGHAFLMLSMIFLFIEILRSTKTGTDSIVNHGLSMVVFIVSLLLFILVPGFGNSIFFLLVAMTFLDFMAGFIVTTVTARRDFGVAA